MADEGKLDSKTLAGWSDEALEAELRALRAFREAVSMAAFVAGLESAQGVLLEGERA